MVTFLAAAFLVVAPPLLSDSGPEAGVLKNSVRVGDRSAMTIVRLPKAGQRRLPVPSRTSAKPRSGGSSTPGSQAWFWDIDPATATPDAGRWAAALATLRNHRAQGRGLAAESRLRDLARQFDAEIGVAARDFDLSQSLLLAVIAVESAGKTQAVSHKGAQGLMQLIPATAKRFGVRDVFDARQNIRGGAAYLDWLLKQFGEDVILALAGYNAGEGAVQQYRGVPP
jgi:soluble lytic murein transglycosylase-like protein